jgi:putative protease
LCVAYSGRCLLSGYFNHRDPNQGTCTNRCRWNYDVKPAAENAAGDVYLIEEETRPGQLMPIEEDEHGTYILNSKDLRAIEHIAQLTEIGIDSLKIEGRTKSAYYVARTCQSYRQAIDDAVAGRPFDGRLVAELDGLANRGYTPGFYDRHPDRDYQNYLTGYAEDGWAEIEVKNKFSVGDRIELIHPAGNRQHVIERMQKVGAGGTAPDDITVAPGSGYRVRVSLPPAYEGAFLARFA